MSTVFRLPDLGEGLTEAEVLEWGVAAGDTVAVDQIVVDVETAKAAVEVPIPVAGTVVQHAGEVGDQIPIGSVFAVIDTEVEAHPHDYPSLQAFRGDG